MVMKNSAENNSSTECSIADLPKAVEEYAHRSVVSDWLHILMTDLCIRVAPANASGYSRAGVVVNFVTATGGDVEMLRSIECFYK